MRKTRAQRRREARMQEVARLRAKGWSLRQIAERLDISHETVRGDLAKSSNSTVANLTKPVKNVTRESDTTNVIQLNRRAQ
jgi:lambda repressor-like predicted transcriptional regulator